MATRSFPPRGEDTTGQRNDAAEPVEVRASIRTLTNAQIVIAFGVVLGICYFAKLVLVTILCSLLIAFVLDPFVDLLRRVRIPRSVGSAIAILVLGGLLYGLSYFFYQRAVDFIDDLPRATVKIRQVIGKYQKKTEQLQERTREMVPQTKEEKGAVSVKVRQDSGLIGLITSSIGSVTEVIMTAAFVPFLVFFMLTWQAHARAATIRMFGPENQTTAYVTMRKISEMLRSFIAGNFVVGLFMAICSIIVFAILKLPYFYFLGLLSGFLSLVPYLGVLLALMPPLALGIGSLKLGGVLAIGATVIGLHLFALNVLYPKYIGKRLQLNPLLVTLSLLIWGWLWGAMGLILAVPLMGALKIICDHVESLRPLGEWMGD
jgi:predicted PurR-regulated permease PerM